MSGKNFEVCKVNIRHVEKGTENLLNTVQKSNVTPPEYLLLEQIHGPGNIEFVELQTVTKGKETFPAVAMEQTGFDGKGRAQYSPRSHDQEYDRLIQWYGQSNMAEVYTSKNPKLHFTFEAAGINTELKDNVTNLADATDKKDAAETVADALKKTGQGKE